MITPRKKRFANPKLAHTITHNIAFPQEMLEVIRTLSEKNYRSITGQVLFIMEHYLKNMDKS